MVNASPTRGPTAESGCGTNIAVMEIERMGIERIDIPVSFEAWGGLGAGAGMISSTEEGLAVETQVKDDVVGLVKTDVNLRVFDYSDLIGFDVDVPRLPKTKLKLTLRFRSLKALEGLPGTSGSELKVRADRDLDDKAREISARVRDRSGAE